MGAEFDHLTLAILDLEEKVTAVEAFIASQSTPAATPAQLEAFALQIDAANARLATAVLPV